MTEPFLASDGSPLFSPDQRRKLEASFYKLVCLMARMRRPGGCPWDAAQTPQSLQRYVLEESYELIEAIDQGDWQALKEELGDFLFQAVFQAEIQAEAGRYDIADVIDDLCAKMVQRHPHVFGDAHFEDREALGRHWEAAKRREKPQRTSALDGIAKGLPALLESYKIAKKAARVGFDWQQAEQVLDKVEEEIGELREAIALQRKQHVAEEMGDLFFALASLARKLDLEPEEITRRANQKFTRRFKAMETIAKSQGKALNDLNLEQMEALWQDVKIGEQR